MESEEIKLLKLKQLETELEIKQAELALKKKELHTTSKFKKKLTIEQATIMVAVIGFIGSFLGTYLQGVNAQQQKKQEFESNLITKAIETGNSAQSKENLKFLIDAGLIEENKSKIKIILSDSSYQINWISNFKLGDSLSTSDLTYFVNKICQSIGLNPNFTLRPSTDIPTVIAVADDGKRIIFYNPKWVSKITNDTKTNWSIVIPLAHECAHHLLGHITGNNDSLTFQMRRQQELEADKWSGYVAEKMGATLEESERVFHVENISDADDTYSSYPKLSSRLSALREGWEKAKSSK